MARARLLLFGALIVLGASSAAYFQGPQSAAREQPKARAVAVQATVAVAAERDVPVYLSGLGTVQASETVAIHAQVEGELEEVLFSEGQQVKKGDVLARIEPRLFLAALGQAKAKRAQDAALLAQAEKDLTRFTALGEKSIVARQDVEQQQAKFEQLKAAVASDDAAIETAQTRLDYTTIRAPSDGRVGIRLIDRGNLIRAADASAITTLVVTRPSAVIFTLPASNLDSVRAAMARGAVEVTALDQDNARVLSRGRLLLIDNSIDAATATIRLKAMFANSDDRLWPGEFVNARVLIDTRKRALTIPTAAIQRGPQGTLIWVVAADNTVQVRAVEIGPVSGELTVITKGLTPGETVVVDNHIRLRAGVPIERAPPPEARQ